MQIEVYNRQRGRKTDIDWLRAFAEAALERCSRELGEGEHHLLELPLVEVNIVSDRTMISLHKRFMDDPTTTDVITFQHGEIFVCADVAAREGKSRDIPFHHELGLYIVHGLLHLNGYDDLGPGARKEMHKVQSRIWKQLCGTAQPRL